MHWPPLPQEKSLVLTFRGWVDLRAHGYVWLKRYATSRTVPGSIPVVSLGIFSVVPPTEPCALRSTQPPKVSTRDLSWGKGGRCVWVTTYHPSSAETSRKSGALIYPEPLGPPRLVAGDLYFTLHITLRYRRIGDGNILFYSFAVFITTYVPKKRASIYK